MQFMSLCKCPRSKIFTTNDEFEAEIHSQGVTEQELDVSKRKNLNLLIKVFSGGKLWFRSAQKPL
jgi:hypothetical protein